MSLAIASASSSSLNVVTDDDRAEDLLLEDAHLVVALEDRRLDVVAAGELAAEIGALAAGEAPRRLPALPMSM